MTENTPPTKPYQKFEGHTDWVRSVMHLPGGQQFMTCSIDGSIGVWNLQTGKQIANWRDGESPMFAAALSVDGKKVVSGSEDGVVRLWSIETGKVIARWTGHTEDVLALCWNGDGERVLSGSRDGTTRVWDVKTGKTMLEIKTSTDSESAAWVFTAIYSTDSTLIATSGAPSWEVKIWDANTGKLVSILKGHTDNVNCLAWTADGKTLISGSHDNSIRTWSTTTWEQIAVLTAHTGSVYGIAISPNDCILASASWDHTARLWNLKNGQPIGLPLQHPDTVNPVSFSTDGMLLATGCNDHNAYTWDIGAIIQEASLHELLLSPNDREKPFLHADATRRPDQPSKNARKLPASFFADLPDHPDPPLPRLISLPPESHNTCPILPPPAPRDTPEGQPNYPERGRLWFLKWLHRRSIEAMELQEPPSAVADVPLAHRKLLYASKGDVDKRKKQEEARKAKNANQLKNRKNSGTSCPLPTQGSVDITQPSARSSRVKTSSGPQDTAFTQSSAPVHTNPASATMLAAPSTNVGNQRAELGCWTRFVLCIGCVSAQYANGH